MQGNRTMLFAGACLFFAGALLFLFFFDPAAVNFYPKCPLNLISGLYCPGCGSIRATHALLHGQIFAALSFNPLWVLMIPILVLISIPRFRPTNAWFPWMIFWVTIAFGILRNLPWWPFIWLAPRP